MQALFVSPPFQLAHIFLDGDWPTFSSLQMVNFVISLKKKQRIYEMYPTLLKIIAFETLY